MRPRRVGGDWESLPGGLRGSRNFGVRTSWAVGRAVGPYGSSQIVWLALLRGVEEIRSSELTVLIIPTPAGGMGVAGPDNATDADVTPDGDDGWGAPEEADV